LIVYVPMDQGRTDHALIELEAAGVVMQPGQQPPARNTRLSLVARNAFRSLRGEAEAAEIEKQVEAGKLSLADLDALSERKDSGVLSLRSSTAPATRRRSPSPSWPATATTPRSRRRRRPMTSSASSARPSRPTFRHQPAAGAL
jgi:hypothetical protein